MKTKTIEVATCPDWDLVLATNWTALQHDLKPEVEEEVLVAVWEKQDGYGVPGFNPPQGWDFSGIRDSTPRAKRNMAKAVRRVLKKHGIASVTVSWDETTVRYE
ncbi:MAG: hypothetical protein ACLQNE_32055 [Thermoguttaceae bacterium]